MSKEKFIKGKTDLENSYKQYKELSLFKHYLFDINELTKIKIDVTFILPKDNLNNNIKEDINTINNKVFGIHKGNNRDQKNYFGVGIFLSYPIKKFINEIKLKQINKKYKLYIENTDVEKINLFIHCF